MATGELRTDRQYECIREGTRREGGRGRETDDEARDRDCVLNLRLSARGEERDRVRESARQREGSWDSGRARERWLRGASTPLHQAAYGSPAVRSHSVWEWGYEIERERRKAERETRERGRGGGSWKEELEEICSDEKGGMITESVGCRGRGTDTAAALAEVEADRIVVSRVEVEPASGRYALWAVRGGGVSVCEPGAAAVTASACMSQTGRGCSKPLPWAQRLLAAPSEEENQVGWGVSWSGGGWRSPRVEELAVTRTVVLPQSSSLHSREAHLPFHGSDPLDLLLWQMRGTFPGGACGRVWMLGSTGSNKDTEPFPTGTQLSRSFIEESILGFDHELRSLESAHCGNPKASVCLCLGCRIYNMSTWL